MDVGVECLVSGFRESVFEFVRDLKLNEIMMFDGM